VLLKGGLDLILPRHENLFTASPGTGGAAIAAAAAAGILSAPARQERLDLADLNVFCDQLEERCLVLVLVLS